MKDARTITVESVHWPNQPLPLVMTTDEVASLLRCPEKTIERYVYAHQLEAIQIGRERRFRGTDVLDFINRRPTSCRGSKNSTRRKS